MALVYPVIFGGAAPTSGDYLVRFIDFDGTILKQQWVLSGQSATAPTIPTHALLTFNSWNNTFTNVTRNIDVGAMYDVTDEKTYLFVFPTTVTGLQPTIYLKKADGATLTIDWGDGNSQTSSASGNISIAKTAAYATVGAYTITISCSGNYSFENSYVFGNTNYSSILMKFYAGTNCTALGIYAFRFAYSLKYVMLHKDLVLNERYTFNYAYSLFAIIIPTATPTLQFFLLADCYSIQFIVIPDTVTDNAMGGGLLSLPYIVFPSAMTGEFGGAYNSGVKEMIPPPSCTSLVDSAFAQAKNIPSFAIPDLVVGALNYTFSNCYSIKFISVPVGITSLGQYVFHQCYSLVDIIFYPTTPPTLANINSFASINLACKIYVPDASVSAYQAATNWVTYASYIYPISELAEYAGTIFFQCNGGNAVKQIKGIPGAIANAPSDPTKAGFSFAGWYKEAALTTAWNWASDVSPATNITLYAKWV